MVSLDKVFLIPIKLSFLSPKPTTFDTENPELHNPLLTFPAQVNVLKVPLNFVDKKKYTDRLKTARELTGQDDAVLIAKGKVQEEIRKEVNEILSKAIKK